MLDGHVLSFGQPGDGGRFSHLRWTVAGRRQDELVNLMVTTHEAHHAALNSGTAWGALLQATAIAATLLPAEPNYVTTLNALAGRCRTVHEAYATHCSLVSILNADPDSTLDALLAHFPTYRTHWGAAVAVGPGGSHHLLWRQLAAESALLACMQPCVLRLGGSLADFRPSDIVAADSPDSRYHVLRKNADRLWQAVDDAGARVVGTAWDDLTRLDARTSDLPDDQLLSLRQLFFHAASELLAGQGHPSMTVDEVQQHVGGVINALSEVLGQIPNPMVDDSEHRFGLASLYELERIELRAPRPVRVRPARSVDPTLWVSGAAPDRHVYLVVRRSATLRRQFDLADDPWGPDEPVCAVQASRDEPGGGRSVELYPLAAPEELTRSAAERGVLASVAVSACQDPAWHERWLPALSRSTVLTMHLDQPVLPAVDALVEAGHGFWHTLVRVRHADGWQFVFACGIEGEPPLIGLCSLSAGQAFAEYAARRSGRPAAPYREVLGTVEPHLPLLVAHFVLDESYLETAL